MTDLEYDLINITNNLFKVTKQVNDNYNIILSDGIAISDNVLLKYLKILLLDFTEREEHYQKKYPQIYRKHKIKRLLK